MERVLGFLIRYFSNYYTLHRSDLAARAAPLDPRLVTVDGIVGLALLLVLPNVDKVSLLIVTVTRLDVIQVFRKWCFWLWSLTKSSKRLMSKTIHNKISKISGHNKILEFTSRSEMLRYYTSWRHLKDFDFTQLTQAFYNHRDANGQKLFVHTPFSCYRMLKAVSYTHLRSPRDKRQSRMPSSA